MTYINLNVGFLLFRHLSDRVVIFEQLMTTMEAIRVHCALTAPLPQSSLTTSLDVTSQATTDDEQISEATLLQSLRQMQVRTVRMHRLYIHVAYVCRVYSVITSKSKRRKCHMMANAVGCA